MADSTEVELDAIALLAELLLLALAIVIGRFLQRKKVVWLGTGSAALLLGLVVGLILQVSGLGDEFGERMSFKSSVFLFVLLPTIMFEAGYSLDPLPFIRNFGLICLLAFLGTTVSTFVIGLVMWMLGYLGWCYEMPLLYALTFGALISATDPVAVLSVFSSLGAKVDLNIVVFGESVLNDAVAMVLYNTISRFLDEGQDITAGSVFKGIGIFVGIFIGSVAIGMLMGVAAALTFRTGFFLSVPALPATSSHPESGKATPVNRSVQGGRNNTQLQQAGCTDTPSEPHSPEETAAAAAVASQQQSSAKSLLHLNAAFHEQRMDSTFHEDNTQHEVDETAACFETGLVILYAFLSYMIADALFLSGITAIIFAGMVMNAYMRPNISDDAARRVHTVFKTLAILFEVFLFVYVGLSLFLMPQKYNIIFFTIFSLVALGMGRYANVYPLCHLCNFLRLPEKRVTQSEMLMLWWSGLRGPMAFALAVDAAENFGEHGKVMKTCTLYVILITVLFNGGTAGFLMKKLRLRQEDEDEDTAAAAAAAGTDAEAQAGGHTEHDSLLSHSGQRGSQEDERIKSLRALALVVPNNYQKTSAVSSVRSTPDRGPGYPAGGVPGAGDLQRLSGTEPSPSQSGYQSFSTMYYRTSGAEGMPPESPGAMTPDVMASPRTSSMVSGSPLSNASGRRSFKSVMDAVRTFNRDGLEHSLNKLDRNLLSRKLIAPHAAARAGASNPQQSGGSGSHSTAHGQGQSQGRSQGHATGDTNFHTPVKTGAQQQQQQQPKPKKVVSPASGPDWLKELEF